MRHDISIATHGFRLRPITESDAAFVVALRNSPHAAGKIGAGARTVEDQLAWLVRHFAVPDDYLFIIESAAGCEPCGMLGIYGIDGKSGEWGRWVIRPGVPAAAASALLALDICFGRLGLEEVWARIVATNREVISFHERIGYERIGSSTVQLSGTSQDVPMVEYRATKARWSSIRACLVRHASLCSLWIAG